MSPSTQGSGNYPPGQVRALWDKFRQMEARLQRLEQNRNPRPLQTSNLSDSGPLSQVPHGHSGSFDEQSGTYLPAPTLAELVFVMTGALSSSKSPPHHSRYTTKVIGVAVAMGTWASDFSIELIIGGTTVITLTINQPNVQFHSGEFGFPVTYALPAYTPVQMNIVAPGTGNADMAVHVELGSAVAGNVGPVGGGQST